MTATVAHRREALLSALLITSLAGCPAREAERKAPPPPAVEVAHPIVREITEWDDYTGRLAADESVEIRARVGGYLDSVNFKDGQVVTKGDLLFVIDPRPFKAVLAAAESEVKRLETRLELAKNDVARGEKLVATHAISTEDFDVRSKALEEAVAALEGTRARREQTRLDVEFTEVRAPMSGRVGRHLVSVGNLISGGSAQSTLLTTIVALDPIRCYFDVEEQAFLTYSRRVMSGELTNARDKTVPARIALGDEDDFRFNGHVDFVDNQFDAQTGSLRGRAVVENPNLTLLPNLFVRIRLPGSGQYRAVLVPDECIGTDQSNRFVYLVDSSNKVSARTVTLGRVLDGLRIVKVGLDGTETVVVKGLQRIRSGVTVTAEISAVGSGASFVKGG